MLVKMNTKMAGPDGVFLPGKIYDFHKNEARELIAGRFAEPVDAAEVKQPPKQSGQPETATAGKKETTTTPAGEDGEKSPPPPAGGDEPRMEHIRFGNYDVFNAAGERVAESVKKAAALQILAELKKEAA